jgi:TolB protein
MIFPKTNHSRIRQTLASLLAIFLLFAILVGCGSQTPSLLPSAALPTDTPRATNSATSAATQTPYVITATSPAATAVTPMQGMFFLSLAEAGHDHLFAYAPSSLAFTRITDGNWDDRAPALSPDGKHLAFSSNRNGYWNIYSLDLLTTKVEALTDSPEYKGNPSWSLPDGAFLTYDTYINNNLEIFIRSITDSTQLFQITQDPGADSQPAWSPRGRSIAFVSNRSGDPEIWVANLDSAGSFTNVSQNSHGIESHPAWSPDGSQLAWASTDTDTGTTGIFIWDADSPDTPPQWISSGDWPIWQDATHISARLTDPNHTYLTSFTTTGLITLAPVLLPAPLEGLIFGNVTIPFPGLFASIAQETPSPLFETVLNPQAGVMPGRSSLVDLNGVEAPYPQLHEQADDSFQALRDQVARSIGWDALASLENAFIPLTTSLDPGLGEDWLYTGRAFTLNPVFMDAGWMAIVREAFGQQTYWRIYLRATAQDGSQGSPLDQIPWDFSARTADSSAYESGGKLMASIPPGYWFDLSSLAIQYGWERLPSLTNWRTYYAGARFNELAYTQGLNWRSAMLQLYPPEVLVTPTMVIPPTRTPTRTPMYYRSPTPTRTPTMRPTNTP